MKLMERHKPSAPSLPGLISYIQTVAEREKAVIARELHDDLGGMLVAASMDLSWLEQHFAPAGAGTFAPEIRRRLDRLKETLGDAVDIKRRIIEELRPTLLDNVGLFAALGWLVATTCARASIEYQVQLPKMEPRFGPDASIALFRVAQEGLAVILESEAIKAVQLSLEATAHFRTLTIAGYGPAAMPDDGPAPESYELATIRHRLTTLGGGFSFSPGPGELRLCAWIPGENGLLS